MNYDELLVKLESAMCTLKNRQPWNARWHKMLSRQLAAIENLISVAADDIKPCPWCGGRNIVPPRVGSPFGWWSTTCDDCGATGPTVRRQKSGEGTNEDWDHEAAMAAMAAWNRRATE